MPDHPQLELRDEGDARSDDVEQEIELLLRFLRPEAAFLEIGAGDCALSLEVARLVRRVHAVDVSEEIAGHVRRRAVPSNFELSLSDGRSVPLPAASIDVAYSNQLLEHLHPEDAREQTESVRRALVPGGRYICVTPSRLSGPHDISAEFDDVATGFHLHEYTTGELVSLMRSAGFRRVQAVGKLGRLVVVLPVGPLVWLERLLTRLPRRLSRRVARGFPIRKLLGRVIATS